MWKVGRKYGMYGTCDIWGHWGWCFRYPLPGRILHIAGGVPQLCGVEPDSLRSHCGVQPGLRAAFWKDVLQNKVCKPVAGDNYSVQEKQDSVLSQVCPHLRRSRESEEGVLGTQSTLNQRCVQEPGGVLGDLKQGLGWGDGTAGSSQVCPACLQNHRII